MTHRRRPRSNLPPAPLEKVKPKGKAPQLVQPVQGEQITDNPPFTITTRQRVMRSGTDRKTIRWFNDGPDRVVMGGVGVTTDGGLPIDAGQGFLEEVAPNAEWYAVSEGTSTLRVQVIK